MPAARMQCFGQLRGLEERSKIQAAPADGTGWGDGTW